MAKIEKLTYEVHYEKLKNNANNIKQAYEEARELMVKLHLKLEAVELALENMDEIELEIIPIKTTKKESRFSKWINRLRNKLKS